VKERERGAGHFTRAGKKGGERKKAEGDIAALASKESRVWGEGRGGTKKEGWPWNYSSDSSQVSAKSKSCREEVWRLTPL